VSVGCCERQKDALQAKLQQAETENKALREALSGLYDHTKNDMQICGLNEVAQAALAQTPAPAGEKPK
jgi:hypothetical protein